MGKPKRNSGGFSAAKQQITNGALGSAYKEEKAVSLINQGKLQEAEAIYRELIEAGTKNHTVYGNLAAICGMQSRFEELIDLLNRALEIEPNHADSHNNMGNALKQKGDLDAAIASYNRALRLKPDYSEAHNNLGIALMEQGDLDAAIASFNTALELKPNNPEAHYNVGIILRRKGKLDAAIMSYKATLQLKPNDPRAHNGLGNALKEQGNLDAAITSYNAAIQLKSDYAEAHNNLGIALMEHGDLDAAIASLNIALQLKPNYPEARYNLGNVLQEKGELEAAIASFNAAIQLKPNYPEAHNNLGNALQEQEDLDAAIATLNIALQLKPNYPEAHYNIGNVLQEKGELTKAIASYNTALELKPNYPEAHWNAALTMLLGGDYKNGLEKYEWRAKLSNSTSKPCAIPNCSKWHGEPLSKGTKLLLVTEQGLGDILQFMRYALVLQEKGICVSFCAPPRLHPLIIASELDSSPISPEEANEVQRGYWAPLLSVPMHLGISQENPIFADPYIKPKEELIIKWKGILRQGGRPTIGINWRGNRQDKSKQSRNIPTHCFRKIHTSTEGNLICLQRGSNQQEIEEIMFNRKANTQQPSITKVADSNDPEDFHEYAAIISNCDLVITTGSTVAHLAAGIGIPTWVLLPKAPDWRWGLEGDTTFWYPSMRLFRQRERGNWDEVVQHVAEALQDDLFSSSKPKEPRLGSGPAKSSFIVRKLKPKGNKALETSAAVNNEEKNLTKSSADNAATEQKADTLLKQGRIQEAETIFRGLITRGTKNHITYGNLAAICGMQGKLEELIYLIKKALELKPDFPEAHNNLGIALQKQGDLDKAIECYKKAIKLKPSYREAHCCLGLALQGQGQLNEAITSYKNALKLKTNCSSTHNNIGNAFQEQGDLDAAITSYKTALTLNPNYVEAHYNHGNALLEKGDLEAAISSYKTALTLNPNYLKAHYNLGNTLKVKGDLGAAIASFKTALTLNPNYLEAHNNLGTALEEQGYLTEAIDAYNRALELESNFPEAQKNLSLLELLGENYQSGWLRYEYRFKCNKDENFLAADPPCERWNGQRLSKDSRLIIVCEQGLGDILQFMRYVLTLKDRNIDVSLCAPLRLHPLIRASGIDQSPLKPEQANEIQDGYWEPLLSVPGHLKVSERNPIVTEPYITSSDNLNNKWAEIFSKIKGPIVGINWRGNRPDTRKKARNIPTQTFKRLTAVFEGHLLSLQRDTHPSEIEEITVEQKMTPHQLEVLRIADSDNPEDFLEYAAIITNCDLVITTGSTVAHMAAGLGIPTWVLLPKVPDWRWGLKGDTTFWYPSMRLFRQRETGNWDQVIEQVAEALHEQFCTRSTPKKRLAAPDTTKNGGGMRKLKRGKSDAFETKPAVVFQQKITKGSTDHAEKEQQAVEMINQGQLLHAEAILEELINDGSDNPTVYVNLALICGMQKKFSKLIKLSKKAIYLNPNHPEPYNNLGIAHHKLGDLNAAITAYKTCLQLNIDFRDAHYNLGNALKEQGNLSEAISSYKKALEINPTYPDAHNNCGNALKEQGDLNAAIACFNTALQLKPDYYEAHNNLGNALKKQGDLDAAIASYNTAIQLKPDYSEAHNNLGIALMEQGDLDAAISSFNTAIQLKLDYSEGHNNLGIALMEQGDLDAAISSFNTAVQLKQQFPEAHNNLGNALKDKGDLDSAIDSFNKALQLRPNFPEAHKDLSMAELLTGDYRSGLIRYENRLQCQKEPKKIVIARPSSPQWNGEELNKDARLILVAEQGLGDTIQFMRYTLALRDKRYKVSLCAPPKLHPLIKSSSIDPAPLTPEQANQVSKGAWLPLLSILRHLNVSPRNPIVTEPYIKSSEDLHEKWKCIFSAENKPTIGINWRGNRGDKKRVSRNIPTHIFRRLNITSTGHLVPLQRDAQQSEIEEITFNQKMLPHQLEALRIANSDNPEDFLEYAAIISNCDLVITTGSTVAHLAAGIGIPTWVLLPKVPDWRWGLKGDATFWYPTMRLFRQRETGNWYDVIERVEKALQEHSRDNSTPTKHAEDSETQV